MAERKGQQVLEQSERVARTLLNVKAYWPILISNKWRRSRPQGVFKKGALGDVERLTKAVGRRMAALTGSRARLNNQAADALYPLASS